MGDFHSLTIYSSVITLNKEVVMEPSHSESKQRQQDSGRLKMQSLAYILYVYHISIENKQLRSWIFVYLRRSRSFVKILKSDTGFMTTGNIPVHSPKS